jgi:hypothetical protein
VVLPTDIDSPLADPRGDILGRDAYAKRIADMVGVRRGAHSTVIAIYGEWGSGKTTFKNFILKTLEDFPDARRPLVVEFNPWEWEGPRQVAEAFFATLAEEIGLKGAAGAEVSTRLGRYAAYFSLGGSIAGSAATILPFLIPGAGPLAALVAKGLAEAGTQSKAAADAPSGPESLSALRASLISAIQALNRTIVVAIDDVDRLTASETAILFQVLKSNADFPNVVYLVFCDRQVVADNLEHAVAGRGEDYLEKIIQLGLPLPKAHPEQLRTMLLTGVTAIMRTAGVEALLNRDRLFNVYDYAEPFFRTVRDVKRFLANVETILPSVVHDGKPDVDLVDFIASEVLRVFDSEFYESLYLHRSRVTGLEGVPSNDAEFVLALQGAREPDGATLSIFVDLFPRFGPRRTLPKRPRGIADPRSFDRYFAFAVPPNQYSPTEEEDVLARRHRHDFIRELESARERGRLQYLLELLAGSAAPMERDELIQYLASLGAFTDKLSVDEGADERAAYRGQIERLIFDGIRPHLADVRTEILLSSCEKSGSIWFPVAFESHFRNKEADALTAEGPARLREIAATRLETAFETDRLRSHPALGELLLWESENGNVARARSYAANLVTDDEGLLALLSAFSHPALSNGAKFRKQRLGFRTFSREITKVVPISTISKRIAEVDENKTSWRERELLRSFADDARRLAETDAAAAEISAEEAKVSDEPVGEPDA